MREDWDGALAVSTWTSRDGHVWKITEMEDRHLLNTIKLLERAYARAIGCYLLGPQPRGEMAQDAFDAEFDALDEGGPEAFHPAYAPLVAEAESRGIDSKESRRARCLSLDLAVLSVAVERREA